MSSVALNSRASSLEQLQTINRMAQSAKGTAAGRIGLLDGHVIKFNTHWQERLFGPSASPEMIKSCDNLRSTICDLIDKTLGETDLAASLKAKIQKGQNKSLLDRSVVANVIRDVENNVNADAVGYESSWLSSSAHNNTSFENVKREVADNHESGEAKPRTVGEKLEAAKDGLLSEIKGVSNDTNNKVLTVGTRKFLEELIDLSKEGPKVYQEEVDARFEAFKAEVGKVYRGSNRGVSEKYASTVLNNVFARIEELITSTKVDESVVDESVAVESVVDESVAVESVADESVAVESVAVDEMTDRALSCRDSLPGSTVIDKMAFFEGVVSRLKEDGKNFSLDEVAKCVKDAARMLDELTNEVAKNIKNEVAKNIKNEVTKKIKDLALLKFQTLRSEAEKMPQKQPRGAGDVSRIEESIVHIDNLEIVVKLFLDKASQVG